MQWYEHVAEHLFLLLVVWGLVQLSAPTRRRAASAPPRGRKPTGAAAAPKRETRLSKRAIDALEGIPPVTVAWLIATLFRRS